MRFARQILPCAQVLPTAAPNFNPLLDKWLNPRHLRAFFCA
jgi:hypothetical protein